MGYNEGLGESQISTEGVIQMMKIAYGTLKLAGIKCERPLYRMNRVGYDGALGESQISTEREQRCGSITAAPVAQSF